MQQLLHPRTQRTLGSMTDRRGNQELVGDFASGQGRIWEARQGWAAGLGRHRHWGLRRAAKARPNPRA